MKRHLLTLLALAILTLPCAALGATYYVAPTATGAGDGSAVNAAGTITTILNGVDFANGDIVVVKSNVVYATTVTLAATIAGNGVTGFTIRGSQAADGDWGDGTKDVEDDGPPIWNGNSVKPFNVNATSSYKIVNLTLKDLSGKGQGFLATKDEAVDLLYINGLVIDNFDYNGHTDWGGTTYGKNLIGIELCKGAIEVKNCTIQNSGPLSVATTGPSADADLNWRDYVGLAIQRVTVAGTTISIHDNVFHGHNSDAILYFHSTATITVYNNTGYNCGENFIDVKGSSNVELYNNIVYRESGFTGTLSGSEGNLIHIHDHLWSGTPYYTANVTVRDNYLYDIPAYSAIAIFTVEQPTYTRNVKVYRNYIQNAGTGVYVKNASGVHIYNNPIFDTPTTGRFFYVRHTTSYTGALPDGYSARIYDNTCVANGQIAKGVEAWRSPAGYFVFKNNVFYVNYNGTAYLIDSEDTTKPTFIDNIFYNATAGNQDIIEWNGTAYDESELATWEALSPSTLSANAFGDPGLNDVANDQLWASGAAVAIINTGTDVSDDIADSVNGLKTAATWAAGNWTSDDTLPRLQNGGYDRGAYERAEEPDPEVASNGCPTGTYLGAWGGEHTTGTDYICLNSGLSQKQGTVNSAASIHGDYKLTGNYGIHIPTGADSLSAAISSGDLGASSTGTIWFDIYLDASTGANYVYPYYVDNSNLLRINFQADNTISAYHIGNATSVSKVTTNTVTDTTWTTIGIAWQANAGTTYFSVKVGANAWEDSADPDHVTAFASEPTTFWLGDKTAAGGVADGYRLDNYSIHSTYKATRPDWSTPVGDTTAPTITSLGVCSDAFCTACNADVTDSWGAETVRVCAALSEDVIVTTSPTWTMDCGPTTERVTGSYFQKIDIGGTKYLTASFTFTDGMRKTNPQLYEMTGGVIKDGSGNDLDTTGSAGDLDGTGTITIGAPFPSTNPMTAGTFSGVDEESNPITWEGSYATVTVLKAAFSILDGDHFALGAVTEPGALDLSSDDCAEANPCVVTGTGLTWAGNITFGDWWTTSNVLHGSDVILGASDVHSYSLIPTGSTLQIPEGATGVSIINDTIGGTLVVSETCATLKNLIVVAVNAAGLGAGETATFTNCVFVQSQAVIEATGGGGTFVFTNCLFEKTTANLFTDYAGGDYSLKAASPAIDVGVDLGDDWDVDSAANDQDDNGLAAIPTNVSPIDGAVKVAKKPTLTSDAFVLAPAWDAGYLVKVAATHTGSQWQVCSDASCVSVIWDSGDDASNLESIGVTDRLDPKTTYYFRVKYETAAGWSEYSTVTEFMTKKVGGSLIFGVPPFMFFDED